MKLFIKGGSRSSQVTTSLGTQFVAIFIIDELKAETLSLASELFSADSQSKMLTAF